MPPLVLLSKPDWEVETQKREIVAYQYQDIVSSCIFLRAVHPLFAQGSPSSLYILLVLLPSSWFEVCSSRFIQFAEALLNHVLLENTLSSLRCRDSGG